VKIFLTLLISLVGFQAKANKPEQVKEKVIVLTDDNTISLRTDFNDSSVANLIDQANQLNSKLPSGHPIYLFLRTPGGSIQAGLELFEYLRGLNRPVHTVTLFAASMGFQTVQQLGHRYILRHGVLMSHKARGGIQGEFGGGISQIDTRYGLWLRRIVELDKQTVKRTKSKQTLKSYQDAYSSELWLNGQEAVDQGYADALVTVKCDSSLNNKVESVTESNMFFSVEVLIPKCPLNNKIIQTESNIQTNLGNMKLRDFLTKNPTFKTCQQLEAEKANNHWLEVVCALDSSLTLPVVMQKQKNMIDLMTGDLTNKVIRN